MSFESRANRAAHSINRSVAAVRPAGMGAITKRHRLSMATAVAFAGIIAGASVAFAAMLPGAATEEFTASPTTVAAETTTSTLPTEPGPPIVVLPADGQDPTEATEGQEAFLPEGTEILVLAVDDPMLLTSGGWDEWGYGIDGWETTTTTTKPEEPIDVPITAHQAYGPATYKNYEKIYGTAPPGTRVVLTSAYGSSDYTVGSSGEYYLKVYFSGQPSNEYFPITARVGDKTYTFQFKWTGSYEVSASQYYGPVHDQRYDKVYGTAPPGTVVIATSDYGSSDMTVDGSGSYYLKIHFNETLPAGQEIAWTAKLKDPSGTVLLTKTFSFTYEADYTVTASQYYGPVNTERKDKVYGTAPPGTIVTAVSDYGSSDLVVDGSGQYWLHIYFNETLPAGQEIAWTATLEDPSGTVLLTKTFSFTYEPNYTVTASQGYGPVHDQRYDKVYGTAPPGTVVFATSDYGSSDMVEDGSGSYYLKIHFNETLPADQEIAWTATLEDPSGTELLTKTFSFTYEPNYTVTASQKWGPTYGEPKEKILGTAPPGSLVTATSPFGSASMTVDGTGSFALLVNFTNPTPNEEFTISVTVADQPFDFSFTYVVD